MSSSDDSRPTLTTILPAGRWPGLQLNQMWQERELLWFFAWRDVKIRYKQTVFGAAWAVAQPVLLAVVFTVFLGRLAGVPSDGIPYAVFALSGLVPWTLFSQATDAASMSLVGSSNLVSKVYFERMALPIAAAAAFLPDFLIATVVLLVVTMVYGITPEASAVLLPLFGLFAFITAVGIGTLLAAINVRYRDVKYALRFLLQIALFVTPVAYPASLVPDGWRTVYALNPMAAVIEGARWALLGQPFSIGWRALLSVAVTMLFLLGGAAYFRRAEQTFADVA